MTIRVLENQCTEGVSFEFNVIFMAKYALYAQHIYIYILYNMHNILAYAL